MKRTSGNVLIVVTALLAVFAIFATGFFFWQKYQSEKVQKELFNSGNYSKNIALPKEKESTSVDETANWKTYINKKYGYEFKYPTNIGTIQEDGTTTRLIHNMLSYVFEVVYVPTKESLDTWLSAARKKGQFQETDWTVANASLVGKPALYLQSHYTMQVPGDMYAIKTDNAIYTFFVIKEDPTKATVDQILSTFKFLDQNAATKAGWKMYSDASFGFSFEYPQDVTVAKVAADNSVRLGLGNSSLLSIRSIPLNGMNLRDVADRNAEVATVAGQILIGPAKISVGPANGYWVRGQREGVEYTYIDLPGNKNNYLEIAYLQNEPVDQALQKIIDQIISTIKTI